MTESFTFKKPINEKRQGQREKVTLYFLWPMKLGQNHYREHFREKRSEERH